MTTLNTIIEEEKKEFEARFCNERICRGCLNKECDYSTTGCPFYQNDIFLSTDNATQIKHFLTTAMQRAYEAGKADSAHENTPDTEWEKGFDEVVGKDTLFVHKGKVIKFFRNLLTSHDTYWKERVEHEGQRVANEICKQIRVGKQYTEAELIYIFCKYTQPIRKLSIDVTPTPITNEDNLK